MTDIPFRVCPECYVGKHINCLRIALDEISDEITDCDCAVAMHELCCYCGDPLTDPDCEDGLNHCSNCRRECVVCGADMKTGGGDL